jgi:hypothetical protein
MLVARFGAKLRTDQARVPARYFRTVSFGQKPLTQFACSGYRSLPFSTFIFHTGSGALLRDREGNTHANTHA